MFPAWVLGAVLAFCSWAHAAEDDSLSRLVKAGSVRVASTQASPPMSFINDANEPDGYDIAVAREIFKRLGVPNVVLVADKFPGFVQSIQARKYDVVINGMTKTAERAGVVDFTSPYSVQEFRIWVNASNTDIHDVASLAGKKVGAGLGTSNELWERQNLTHSQIRTYDAGGLLYNDLALGRIDAIIESYFSGRKMQEMNHLPIKLAGEPVAYSLGAAVVPKGADALRLAMNQAIADMLADGTITRLAKQYLGEDYDVVSGLSKAQYTW
ncbi:transporter substrate-binding domain-containing protein [Pseudomonas sp. SDO528_S397]